MAPSRKRPSVVNRTLQITVTPCPDMAVSQSQSSLTASLLARAAAGDVHGMSAVVSHGASVNAALLGDNTALHTAVRYKRATAVRWLVRHGADLDARTATGRTALHLAVEGASPNIVRDLLDGGADGNARTAAGATPLHLAANSSTSAPSLSCAQVRVSACGFAGGRGWVCRSVLFTWTVVVGNGYGWLWSGRVLCCERLVGGFAASVWISTGAVPQPVRARLRTFPCESKSRCAIFADQVLLGQPGSDAAAKDSNGRTALDIAVARPYVELAVLLQREVRHASSRCELLRCSGIAEWLGLVVVGIGVPVLLGIRCAALVPVRSDASAYTI